MTTRTVITIFALVLVSACAIPDVVISRPGFNDIQYTEDLDTCRGGNFLEAAGKTFRLGFAGAFAGAAEGAVNGAIWGGSEEGAIIGAGVGGFVGIGIGTFSAVKEEGEKVSDCLRGKGYALRNG